MSPSALLESLVPKILKIAEKAGKAILEVYNEAHFEVSYKEDNSPLTRADMDAHNIIQAGLNELDPVLPILSEESGQIPYEKRSSWNAYWLVDPLDGTKEFIKRSGEFTVNIALIENGEPILGVVYAPALGVTYHAARGAGAFKRKKNQKPIKIEVSDYRSGKLKIVGSRSHAGKELRRFLGKIDNYELVGMGSSLKLCLVAEGSAHLYPRLGPTMEWDAAAAHCVVAETGGNVIDTGGNTLKYNKPDLLNPSFIAHGNLDYQWRSLFE